MFAADHQCPESDDAGERIRESSANCGKNRFVKRIRDDWCKSTARASRGYSYRSASTGSSFEARIAGTSPLITPTTSNTIPDKNTVIKEIRR
jgi:hypothetical protein